MNNAELRADNLEALAAVLPGFALPATDAAREVDGVWRIEVDGKSVAFHSRDPHREADRIAAQLLENSGDLRLIATIGLGAGYLLEALDRAGWTGKVLAIEPEAAFIAPLLSRPQLGTWLRDGRLRILTGPDFAGAADCWPLFGDGTAPSVLHVNPVLARLRPAGVAQARALVERLHGEAANNAAARRALGGRYLLNTLRNLAVLGDEGDVASLFDAAPGATAIVVAAGPSLDRVLPELRAAQGSAIIICVDTALRPLLAAGIEPSFVVAVDPSEANARHLTDLPACPHTALVAEGSLDPLALAGFRGRTFFFNVSHHQPWPWLEAQGHSVGRLRVWGSVLTTAFDLALELDCTRIAFAGADLSYTDARPYARNVAFEEDWRRRAEWGQPQAAQWADAVTRHPAIAEADVHGEPAHSAAHLIAFRNWLLEQMRKETGRTFLNLTGGGILHGTGISQASAAGFVASLDAAAPRPGPERYRPAAVDLVAPARALLQAAARGDSAARATVAAWREFAAGITSEQIETALARNLAAPPPALLDGEHWSASHAYVVMVDSWLAPLAQHIELVPMRLEPHRLTEWSAAGARMFYFRTTAARLILCSLQLPAGALLEDGVPLAEAASVDQVVNGSYRTCRDEVHFRASDGSDPRNNGRDYVLMVPPSIAALERMPLHDILNQRL